MDSSTAKKLIKETFEATFDRNQFRKFTLNLLNDFEETPNTTYKGNTIPKAYQPYARIMDRLGKFEDEDGRLVDILIIHLKKESSLERARTMQRNLVGWYLNGSRGGVLKDGALVAFVSPNPEDWRFSFVKMEYEIVEKEGGGVKAQQTFTPARRFSFLVGANEYSHTAQKQLMPILKKDTEKPSFSELEDGFSVEPVTERFYEEYRERYLELKDELDHFVDNDATIKEDFREHNVDTSDFAKKLMGQIVFLYFLQKKGWFGVERGGNWGEGPNNFLRQLFEKKHTSYSNFFNDILEPLFYEALATQRPDDYYSRFDCKIPFLNGGLFDPIQNYDWINTDLLLPDTLFSNNEGTGILDVFDRYNFTIKENEPLEKEVAVDPEMLGKVFENLLKVEDRKSKGTFYTPREIVHYMCQESLIQYLDTELGSSLPVKDIEVFVRYGEQAIENDRYVEEQQQQTRRYSYEIPEAIRHNAGKIDEKLATIRVCDPAVGSGAFLVGMMNEIVRKREVLTSYLSRSSNRNLYNFKLKAIHDCLYGVDIDPGAVEIAKLRLWLSLVVEEENFERINALPNLDYKIMQGNSLLEDYEGIKLIDEQFFAKPENNDHVIEQLREREKKLQREYIKLHQEGNLTDEKGKELQKQLKKIPKKIKQYQKQNKETGSVNDLFGGNEARKKAKELLERQKQFFEASRQQEKQNIKVQIETLQWELIELTLIEQKKKDKLEEIKKLRKKRIYPFFLWHLHFAEVFQENGGFDVVIANPPYVKEYINKEAFDGFRKSPYYEGKMDLWYGFACTGIDMLKENGIECFIAQNNWVTSSGASIMREKVLSDTQILKMVDFGSYEIFDSASIQTMVMLFQKDKETDNYRTDIFSILSSSKKSNATFSDVISLLNEKEKDGLRYLTPKINREFLKNEFLTFSDAKVSDLLIKIADSKNFSLDKKEVGQGIVAPQDYVNKNHIKKLTDTVKKGQGIFNLSENEKKAIDWNEEEAKLLKPFYTSEELHRYYGEKKNKYWVIYTDSSFGAKYSGSKNNPPADLSKYPNIVRHLDQFKEVITSDWKPYGLHRARDEKFFTGEKIISLRKCSERPTFTYTDFPCYVSQTYFVIKPKNINLKYLTGLFNSKLVMFWLKHKGKMQGNNFQVDKRPIMNIPIYKPKTDPGIETLVDQILTLKQVNNEADTTALEQQIDTLVYKLYNLTWEEVQVVDPKFELSKEEYEAVEVE